MQKTQLSNGSKRKRKKYTQLINIILKSSPKRRGIFPQIQTLKKENDFATAHARSLQSACLVKPISNDTMTLAIKVFERYGYSIFDSLIIAAAIESGCHVLYSEDMQHGHVIEGKLKIINPFL